MSPEARERKRARDRERYATRPEVRARKRASERQRLLNPDARERRRAQSREWAAAHAERQRERRAANWDAIRQRERQYKAAHSDQERQYGREYWAELRAAVLAIYGTACACCGSTRQLEIDHVFGGGQAHVDGMFGGGGRRTWYRWLVWLGARSAAFRRYAAPATGRRVMARAAA